MAFQPTPDGCMVVTPFSYVGFQWSNVLWYRMADFTEADMLDLTTEVMSAWFNEYDAHFGDGCSYGKAIAYDMRTQDGAVVVATADQGHGEATGDPLSPNNCLVLTLRTALRGRAYRGRLYLAGHTESAMTNGQFTEGIITAAEALGSGLMWRPLQEGWTLCVRSGQLNGVQRENAVLTPVTSIECRSGKPGSQRRRVARG
jgi:hypothetical protein